MTAMQAVALYAGLNILLLVFLAANVSLNRRRAKISLGTGNDASLEQAWFYWACWAPAHSSFTSWGSR